MAAIKAGMSASSLSAMQEMSNATIQASQHPDADANKYRKYLNDIFVETMGKPELDADYLKKQFDCFVHCMEEFPRVYVDSMQNPNVGPEKKAPVCTSFSRWLLGQLLRLLCKHNRNVQCEDLCVSLVVALLKLINMKDLPFFKRISSELLSFTAGIIDVSHDSLIPAFFFNKKELQTFKDKCGKPLAKFEVKPFALKSEEEENGHLNLKSSPISVESLASCEHLQVVVLKVLTEILNEIVQCTPHCTSLLWLLLCHDVETGGPHLKMFAITTLTLLKSHTLCLPENPQLVRLIFSCVIGSISFIATSKDVSRLESFEAVLVTAMRTICIGPQWLNFVTFSDVPSSLVKTLALTQSPVVGVAVGDLVTNILRMCPLSAEAFFEVQCGVATLLDLKTTANWFSKLLSATIVKDGEIQRFEKPKRSPDRILPSIITSTSTVFSGSHYLEKTQTWKVVFQHWKQTAETPPQGVHDVLFKLLINCQMVEVLVLLRNCDERFPLASIVLQTWDAWNVVIRNAVSWTADKLAQMYSVAIRYSVALLDRHVFYCLNDEILAHLIGLVGLPWISIVYQHDFPESVHQDLRKLSANFRASVVTDQMADALSLIFAFPSTMCIQWRVSLMQKTLESRNCNLQEVSICALPALLHFGGVDHFDSIECYVWAVASSDVVAVSKVLSENFDLLMCALCKASKSHGIGCIDFCKSTHLTCLCNGIATLSEKCLKQLHRLVTLIVNHQNVEVKLAFVEKLDHILSHVGNDWNLADTCLVFLEDDNYDIRFSFSKHMRRYIGVMEASGRNFETLVSRVKTAYMAAKGRGRWRTVETIILSLSHVGRMVDDDMLLVIVVILLENLFAPIQYVVSTSSMELRHIAEWKGMKTQTLFRRFRKPISKFLSQTLYDAQKRGDVGPVAKLNVLFKVFGFSDLKSLIEVALPDLLPHLVCTASQETTSLIKSLARHLQKDWRTMLFDHFKYIFSYLVCYCTRPELEFTLKYIQGETDIDFGSLLRCDCQIIQNELLLQISNCYEQVFSGLKILASKDDTYSSLKISYSEQMADFLQPRFLGFLTFFDALVQNATVPLAEKLLAIQSLACVIDLMGTSYITSVRMKVLTTLRITLRFQEKAFVQVCCKAWDVFIRRLDITVVGPMLNQIVVAILPLLINSQDEVVGTMNYLFVENRTNLQEHFRGLYFIPEVPGLVQVHSVLKNFQKSSKSALTSLLADSCRIITHENVDVRLHALKNLRCLLAKRKTEVHALILGRDCGDPLVSKLVHSLIVCCRDDDLRIRELLGECLGELGAIDPGRLEIQIESEKEDLSRSCSDVDAEIFAVELVTELARAYLAALDTRIQDCSSYALQEVLRVYEFKKTNVSRLVLPTSNNLWERLSDDVQEIVSPLLNTKYALAQVPPPANLPQPIYCSSKGKTFHSWLRCWAAHLSSKVTRPRTSKIFIACSMIIRHDVQTCQFLLPRILMCVLQEGGQPHIDEVYQEVITVLNNTADTMMLYPDLHHMSVQTVFSLLDFLRKWVAKNGSQVTEQPDQARPVCESTNAALVRGVQTFLDRIPNEVLAWSSYNSQAYTRALMHLEIHIKNNPERLQNELSFLQKLYGALDEPDGIAGVISLRRDVNLQDLILSHESTGKLQDALSCYERAIHLDNDDLSNHQGLLRCMMGLDQPHMALTYANGLLPRRPDWMSAVNRYRVEAAWKLTSWNDLDTFLKCDNSTSSLWEVGIGKVLSSVKTKEKDLYNKQLVQLRLEQMAPLSAASMENGSYQRGYDFLVKLHMVNEMEKAISTFTGLANPDGLEALLSEWHGRQQLIQPSTLCLEPLMGLRRVLLALAVEQMPDQSPQLEQEIGRCWLRSAKVARKCGHLQRAYSYLLTANKFQLPETYREQAKWHWQKGEQDLAMSCLNKVIREHYSDLEQINAYQSPASNNFKSDCAKTKLLLARYTEESGHLESNAMIEMYKEVLDLNPDWEDCHFYLARYFDRILLNNTSDRIERRGELVMSVIKHFGHSLLYGCHNIYQSLPRLLSLWLDFSAALAAEKDRARKTNANAAMENIVLHIHQKLIGPLFQQLPLYLFLTVFSQLVSRICHSNVEVFSYLKDILAKLLVNYPQQAMWMMTSVSKSSYKNRAARCREIFVRAQNMDPTLCKFLAHAVKLTDMLLALANKQFSSDRKQFSMNKEFPGLVSLLQNPDFSKILLPIQSSMTVKLPTALGAQSNYEPFPKDLVCIASIHDSVEIMPSLQKPKKFSFLGTDGKTYPMMSKPKDDLRKDFRLMEFNSVVNKFLLRDTESRRRQLHIRTYAVVPLNEECGLIEWVHNLYTMRHILNTAYRNKGLYVGGKSLSALFMAKSAPLERKVDNFRTKILPRFPPVFGEWLLKTFSDPTAWYLARLSFARTAAVMSMVGYILGLGDRHGENILFDCNCGDVVHVDFNCLFNKGETFDYPELVPFRLTHNMVEAMGPLGYEGVYRKSCEVSLLVMRKQRDTLMSILRPFVYDPLMKNNRAAVNQEELGEIVNEKAKFNVREIEFRLEGKLKNKTAKAMQSIFPLSIEGQVNHLILEATDHKNLAQMYVGWGPHM